MPFAFVLSRSTRPCTHITLILCLSAALLSCRVYNRETAATLAEWKNIPDSLLRNDSLTVAPGNRYVRQSKLYTLLFGKHYRSLWGKSITVRVFNPHTDSGYFQPVKLGGGDQTYSIDIRTSEGPTYSLRSVNKDQAGILPERWKWLPVKSVLRDQGSALFPYAPLVCRDLQEAAGIYGTHPTLVFVPLRANEVVSQNDHGYLAWLEIEPDDSWTGERILGFPEAITGTRKMLEHCDKGRLSVDVTAYLRLRLFDILVGDWDRHVKQMKWGVKTINDRPVAYPIAMDRDMAFYRFDDGVLNKVAEKFAPKLVSFRPEVNSIGRYCISGRELDMLLLAAVPREIFEEQALLLQELINDEAIDSAMASLPNAAREEAGIIARILRQRREQLPQVARKYHAYLMKATGDQLPEGRCLSRY